MAIGLEVRHTSILYAALPGGKISNTSCGRRIEVRIVLRTGVTAGPKSSLTLNQT